jgi:hypothetical protein
MISYVENLFKSPIIVSAAAVLHTHTSKHHTVQTYKIYIVTQLHSASLSSADLQGQNTIQCFLVGSKLAFRNTTTVFFFFKERYFSLLLFSQIICPVFENILSQGTNVATPHSPFFMTEQGLEYVVQPKSSRNLNAAA